MNVGVRFLAQLRQSAGRAAERLDLDGTPDVAALVRALAANDARLAGVLLTPDGRVQPTLLLFIGDEQVRPDRPLRDGDEVTLMTPISGGA